MNVKLNKNQEQYVYTFKDNVCSGGFQSLVLLEVPSIRKLELIFVT